MGGGSETSAVSSTQRKMEVPPASPHIQHMRQIPSMASLNFPEPFALIGLDASLQRPHGSSSLLLVRQNHEDEDVKSELVS